MFTHKRYEIIHRIDRDLTGPERKVCRLILCFLLSKDANTLKHITFKTLMIGARLDESSELNRLYILKAANYLSSKKLHLLDMNFQFIDENCSQPIPIDNDEVSLAINSGKFYHPESGEVVENFNSYIFPYFTPTEELVRLHE